MTRQRYHLGMVVFAIATTMSLLAVCCGTPGNSDRFRYTVEPVHTEQEFLATVKALGEEQGWGDYEIHNSGVLFDAGQWSALVEFVPGGPGRHFTIYISTDGEVRIVPGA